MSKDTGDAREPSALNDDDLEQVTGGTDGGTTAMPTIDDASEVALKKLPGKRKPPTLTL